MNLRQRSDVNLRQQVAALQLISVILILLLAMRCNSQPMYNGKSISMLGANALQMRCAQAVGWNPANLAIPLQPRMTMIGSSFGLAGGNNSFSYDDIINTFQSGKILDSTDKEGILGKLGSGGLMAIGVGTVSIAGMTWNNYALNFDLQSQATVVVPPEIVELFLYGPKKENIYPLDNIRFEASNYLASSASYGYNLTPPKFLSHLSVGGSVKWLKGTGYYGITNNTGHLSFSNTQIDAHGNIELAQSSSGNGLGIDLGVMGESKQLKMAFGMTLGNIIGGMKWSDVTLSNYDIQFPSTIDPEGSPKKEYWDPILVRTESRGEALSRPLARYLLLSARRSFDSCHLIAYSSYYQGLNEAPGNSPTPRLSVGGEWQGLKRIPCVVLRAGIAAGGLERFAFSAGYGWSYGFYRLDIGAAWQMGFLSSAKGCSVGINNYFVIQ